LEISYQALSFVRHYRHQADINLRTMSGPAIHHIIARETITRMKKGSSDAAFKAFCDKALNEWSPYLHFGSQGPDPLLMNLRDVSPEVRRFVELYLDLTDFIDDIKKRIMELIPPEVIAAAEALAEAWDHVERRSVLLTEIEQLLTVARNNMALLEATFVEGVKKYITDAVNLFDELSSPIQDPGKAAPGEWWWFDALHYRKTGQYAEALLRNAGPNSTSMAYAIGHLTHFSADTVGHPFVNLISGGPYRTHGQRHKYVENHHDVYAWKRMFGGEEFVQSKLGEKYVLEGDDKHLPPDLNNLIRNTIKQVYGENRLNYAADMSRSDLDDTYRLWLKWFRSTTNALDLPPPVPYSLTTELMEAHQQFKDNLGDIGDMISGATRGISSVWDLFVALAAAVIGAVLAAAAVLDWLIGTLATLGAAPIRYFLSLTYEYLYNAYMYFHQGVVLNGLAFPFNNQLTHFAAGHVYNPTVKDRSDPPINAIMLHKDMPFKKFIVPDAERDSHLIYPRNFTAAMENSENDLTTIAPKTYFNKDPFWYMFGPMPVDKEFYDFVRNFTEGSSEEEAKSRFKELKARGMGGGLGSAVEFAQFLHKQVKAGKPIPNLNLDGDRGYAFPVWRRVRRPGDLNDPSAEHLAVAADENVSTHVVRSAQTDIIHPNTDIL